MGFGASLKGQASAINSAKTKKANSRSQVDIPEGEYICAVSCVAGQYKNGVDHVDFNLIVVDGEYEGTELKDIDGCSHYLDTASDSFAKSLGAMVVNFKLLLPERADEIENVEPDDFTDLIDSLIDEINESDIYVKVRVKHRIYKDQTRITPYLQELVEVEVTDDAEGEAPAPAAAAKAKKSQKTETASSKEASKTTKRSSKPVAEPEPETDDDDDSDENDDAGDDDDDDNDWEPAIADSITFTPEGKTRAVKGTIAAIQATKGTCTVVDLKGVKHTKVALAGISPA